MNDFQQPRAQFHLHDPPAVALEQQPTDQCGLQDDEEEDGSHVPAVLLPKTDFAKTDLAPRRQPALADAETLQLTPVKHGPGEIAADNGNLRGSLAVEDAQRDPCRRLAYWDRRRNEATGAAIADTGLGIAHERPVGDCGEVRKTFVRTRALVHEARVNDRRIVRQHGHALSDLGHRQADKIDELELSGEGGDFLLVVPAEGLTLPRVTHQRDLLE